MKLTQDHSGRIESSGGRNLTVKWLCHFIGRTSILGCVEFVLIQVAQCIWDWEEGTLMLQAGLAPGTRDGIRPSPGLKKTNSWSFQLTFPFPQGFTLSAIFATAPGLSLCSVCGEGGRSEPDTSTCPCSPGQDLQPF